MYLFKVISLIILGAATIELQAEPTINFKGSVRVRNDLEDQDGSKSRNRFRVRGRLKAYGAVNDKMNYAVRLSTGSASPNSANQTLESGFSTKAAQFDIVSLAYNMESYGLKLIGGKFVNPFYKAGSSQLVWDNDITPEGIGLTGLFGPVFFNLGYLVTEHRKSEDDAFIHAIQIGSELEQQSFKLKFAVAYYDHKELKGKETLFDNTDGEGNTTTTVGATEVYVNDYNILNVGFSVDLSHRPLGIFGQYAENTEVDEDNKAFVAGFHYGQQFRIGYNYRKIERDAVVGLFTNSDFNGGGTDGQGHQLSLSWKYSKGQKIALTQYISEKGIDSDQDYSRTFLDFSAKL